MNMIRFFRAALFILALVFVYFFGQTMERFLFDIVCQIFPLTTDNALFYNAIHLVISVIPLLLFGLAGAISLSDSAELKSRLWIVIWGMLLGIVAFRIYQIWWVLRGGIGEDAVLWTESLSVRQLYFMEKVLPFLMIGGCSSIFISILEKEPKQILIAAPLGAVFSFSWLMITKRIQTLSGFGEFLFAFIFTVLFSFFASFIVKKIKEF